MIDDGVVQPAAEIAERAAAIEIGDFVIRLGQGDLPSLAARTIAA
jgi:hypothetical protein